jgi:hypothetical protein
VDSYTITIAPNDDSGASTTLIVDASGDQVRITDFRLHAAGGITGGHMPPVDFGLLLRALATPSVSPTPVVAAPDAVPALEADAPSTTASAEPRVEARPSAPATSRPRRTRRTAAGEAAPEAAHKPVYRTAKATTAEAKVTDAGPTRSQRASVTARKRPAKKAAAPVATGGRAYRRMPEDFAAVYQQTSAPAAIADHYGVPSHTVQGWIRRVKATTAATQ